MISSTSISVVVAVRNAEESLRRTLLCLTQQSLSNFQIILIDGASTDNTMKIANDFGDYIDVQVSEPDAGIADAWNKGLSHAKGEWIIFLNAGDLLHRDHFARAHTALKEHAGQPVILFCDVLKFNKDKTPTVKIVGRPPSLGKIDRGSIGFAHPGSLSSARCFAEVGKFNTSLRIAIDTDWLLRCVKAGYPFVKFDSCAYMAEGGVSDRKFRHAMTEYFDRAHHWGFVTKRQAKSTPMLLSVARTALHYYRNGFRSFLRTSKHALVSILNFTGQWLPFFWLRRVYFGLLGFGLEQGASIGMGFKFYRTGNVRIGRNSVINRNCLFDNRDCISIGHNVSIARDVSIFTAGHDPESPLFEMNTAPVTIGDHAVIFAGAMVMPGVAIGRGAVVHSGAVVTKDVQPQAIVGGVPARQISKRHLNPDYAINYPYPTAM